MQRHHTRQVRRRVRQRRPHRAELPQHHNALDFERTRPRGASPRAPLPHHGLRTGGNLRVARRSLLHDRQLRHLLLPLEEALRRRGNGRHQDHAAVDFTVSNCRIHHCGSLAGIWFDWMGQGARIVGNKMWTNERDIFLEVDHGPNLVEGNDLLMS